MKGQSGTLSIITTLILRIRDKYFTTYLLLPKTQYGIIENASDDLLFPSYECAHIQQIHQVSAQYHLKNRAQATTENYKNLLKHTTHLHSSHHAQSRFDNPLQSALILGDGIITLADLMTPAYRNPDLQEIFLSCCETGLGVNLELADEPLSLATGFFYAGAKTVISTLWSVSDLATALFTILYYNARHKGETAPAAIQTAQQQLRNLTLDQWQKIAPDLYQVTITNKDAFIAGLNLKIKKLTTKIFDLKTELKKHSKDSQEYKEITEERTKLLNQQNHLRDQIKFFETLANTEKPFTHPQYWAAFVCQGITIDPQTSPQKTNPISQSIFFFNRTLNP